MLISDILLLSKFKISKSLRNKLVKELIIKMLLLSKDKDFNC